MIDCAISAIYECICRDEETAAGGLDPSEATLHAPGFYRHKRSELEQLTGSAIDRKVQVIASGTDSWVPLYNPVFGVKTRCYYVTVRVGYFVGDHMTESFAVIGDDDLLIRNAIVDQNNWPDCSVGCVNGMVPIDARRIEVDGDPARHIWEILVEVTVTG